MSYTIENIDLLHATKSELEAYRLPPRPDDPIQRADWFTRVQRLRNNHCALPVPLSLQHRSLSQRLSTGGSPQAKRNNLVGTFGQRVNGIWAGYIVYDNGGITDIKGHWNTQCLGSQQQPGAREGSWVGIGGVNNSGNLIQTGTALTKSGYQFFIEFVPYDAPSFDGSNLACGTPVDAEVYYVSAFNEWCTFISYSNGSFSTCYDSSHQADNTTAEWIDERPTCSNGVSQLADFNFTDYSNAYALSTSRGWHTIGGFGNDQAIMQDSHGTTLAQPQPLNTGTNSFRDNWKATGDGVACANI